MKTKISLIVASTLALTLIGGCSLVEKGNKESNLDSDNINVVSREDGSGTRGAFIEIVGVLEKDAQGNETDNTYEESIIQNGTDAIMTTVAGDKNSIEYISLGSLNDTVKPLKIEDIEATSENVQNGTYKISRPFNIAYKEDLTPIANDFLDFIVSSEGQSIVVEEGYVAISSDSKEYQGTSQEGKIVIAGSTSVSPVMEKLAENYEQRHSKVSIEIQSTGSSAGMQSAIEGSADIGMASRPLKESEEKILAHVPIAIDGIALIVNNENQIESITLDQVKSIYIGELLKWNEIK